VLENVARNPELRAKPHLAQNPPYSSSVNLLSPPKRRFGTVPHFAIRNRRIQLLQYELRQNVKLGNLGSSEMSQAVIWKHLAAMFPCKVALPN
jgi:hypothetical protein